MEPIAAQEVEPIQMPEPGKGGLEFGYCRVSTLRQNADRQLADLIDQGLFILAGNERTLFTDKCTGSTTNRPELNILLGKLRAGDVLHVHSIDRLGRDLPSCVDLVYRLMDGGVSIVLHKEGLVIRKNMTAVQNAMWQMLLVIAQMEREFMLERQAEGRARAIERGTFKPRGLNRKINHAAIELALREGSKSIRTIAKENGVAPSTVSEVKKRMAQRESEKAGN